MNDREGELAFSKILTEALVLCVLEKGNKITPTSKTIRVALPLWS
jgi:hypothetical protein